MAGLVRVDESPNLLISLKVNSLPTDLVIGKLPPGLNVELSFEFPLESLLPSDAECRLWMSLLARSDTTSTAFIALWTPLTTASTGPAKFGKEDSPLRPFF